MRTCCHPRSSFCHTPLGLPNRVVKVGTVNTTECGVLRDIECEKRRITQQEDCKVSRDGGVEFTGESAQPDLLSVDRD